jgi:anaerobic selenocysteine-containing dehydrogenase
MHPASRLLWKTGARLGFRGDPAQPVTRGFLCAKVAKYLNRVHASDRVPYPMRRVRPKGSVANDETDLRPSGRG